MPSPGNTISSSHRGPVVDITIWSFFIVSGLAVATKVWTKLSRTSTQSARELSRLQLDDFTLTLALGFAAAFSITVSQQVVVGLGSPIDKIEPNLVAKYQKLAYTAQMLYACALCTTNSGVILFGILLQPSPIHRNLLKATLILNAIWSLSSIFAIAFQCRLPHPWAIYANKCIDQTAFWTYFEVIDIVVNLSLASILCSIIWILQMSRMKYLLIAFFSSRALLFIPIGFQFSHLHHIKSTPHWNITPDLATGAILSSAILNTNIFITCLPFLKPTMEYLQPGWSTSSTTTGFMRTGFGYSSMRSGSKSSRTENESEMMAQKT